MTEAPKPAKPQRQKGADALYKLRDLQPGDCLVSTQRDEDTGLPDVTTIEVVENVPIYLGRFSMTVKSIDNGDVWSFEYSRSSTLPLEATVKRAPKIERKEKMSNQPEWLDFALERDECLPNEYSISRIRSKHDVMDVIDIQTHRADVQAHHYLVVKEINGTVDFALLEFSSASSDWSRIGASIVFFGCGYAGSLRECRHTWWGDPHSNMDGYVFYPNGIAIANAFKHLSLYFDDMQEEQNER